MGTLLGIFEGLTWVCSYLTPFVLLVASWLLWRKTKSSWLMLALVGSVLATIGNVTHILHLQVVVVTTGTGIALGEGTTFLGWLAFIVFMSLGYMLASVGLLGYALRKQVFT